MDALSFGKHVQELRKRNGYNQNMLSDRSGVSRIYISKIERGEAQNISVSILEKLANALCVSMSELTENEASSSNNFSESLKTFARQESLTYNDMEFLASMPFRGEAPKTPEQWAEIYSIVKKVLENRN